MHAKTYLITAGLAALQPVAADFKIFLGAQNNYSGGGDPTVGPVKGSTDQAYFFNNPPSCSDHGGVLQVDGNSDVSWSLGFVCDGCTDAPPVPDRLEIHDGDGTFFDNAGDEPHFTIYRDLNTKGNYNIVDLDGNNIGTCTIPSDRQDYTCARGLSADSATETFDCKTKISIKKSN